MLSSEEAQWYLLAQATASVLPQTARRCQTCQSSKTDKIESSHQEAPSEKRGYWTSEQIPFLPLVKLGVKESLPIHMMLWQGQGLWWKGVPNLKCFSEPGFAFLWGAGDFQLVFDCSQKEFLHELRMNWCAYGVKEGFPILPHCWCSSSIKYWCMLPCGWVLKTLG